MNATDAQPTAADAERDPLPLFQRLGYEPPLVRPLDAVTLAALGGLPLRARSLVDSVGAGRHRSRRRGLDIEFVDHRDYQQGDDLRRVDWRLFARTNRLHIREAQTDAPLRLVLLLDVSPSMAYTGAKERLSKLDYARSVLGALALLSRRQHDACGVGLLGDSVVRWLPPAASRARFDQVWAILDAPVAAGGTALATALGEMLAIAPRRCLFVLASDFYEEPRTLLPVLQRVRSEGHELIGLRVLDPMEADLSTNRAGGFVDLETGERLDADPVVARDAYRASFQEHATEMGETMIKTGAEWMTARTDTLPLEILRRFLSDRLRIRRRR
jgi:uncharacterized protein (DUF58 family)